MVGQQRQRVGARDAQHPLVGCGQAEGVADLGRERPERRLFASGANFLNIDGVAEPDNWLHLTWGAASIAFARRALGG